jgi:hypothetical protein
MNVNNTKALAEQHGLKFKDCGGGHVQLSNHGVLVNYYPDSKKRTAHIAGGASVPHCSPWDAVKLCMESGKPGLKPKKRNISKNGPVRKDIRPKKTNPAGLKHFHNNDSLPWDGEGFTFHPADELRHEAYLIIQAANVTAYELREQALELDKEPAI